MKIGYARVSSVMQDPAIQIEQLKKNGCEKIFAEKITGTHNDRAELKKMLETIKPGDELHVVKLDRLGRSTKGMIETIESITKRGIRINSYDMGYIDTESTMGKAFYQIIAVIAECERNFIVERTKGGRDRAVMNGLKLGRKQGVVLDRTMQRLQIVESMLAQGHSQYKIANTLNLSKSCVCKLVKKLPLLKNVNIQ